MDFKRKKLTVFGAVALIILVLDQLTKYWVRTTPELHRFTLIEGWLAFNFTKNPGMAMGISWADTWVISLIAIFATILILVYVWRTMHTAGPGYMICMGLIIGGALGNITDRIFMARVGGYGGVLDGHVVDFIHFKLQIGSFNVFPYIFNVADSAISVAIVTLILFYKKLMPEYAALAHNREDEAAGQDSHEPELTAESVKTGANGPDSPESGSGMEDGSGRKDEKGAHRDEHPDRPL